MQKKFILNLASDQVKTEQEIFELKQNAKDSRVIVLIPSVDVLLTTVLLPKISHSRLIQAIPYALEETLLEDVEQLHFAVGDYPIHGAWPVAIMARKKIQAYLDLLKTWGIKPDMLLPAVLALPYSEEKWHGIVENKMAWVRTGACAGFACDQINLADVLNAAIVEANIKPKKIKIKKDTNAPLNMDQVEDIEGHQEARLFSSPPINLLQNHYAIKKSSDTSARLFLKIGSYLALAWMILIWISPLGSYFVLKNKSAILENKINDIYKKHFPLSTSVVAPKRRMEEKLKTTMQDSGHSNVFRWLSLVGQNKQPGIQLQQFDFKNHLLTLEIISDTSEDVTQLMNRLSQQGLHVKLQNAVVVDSKIKASLQLS